MRALAAAIALLSLAATLPRAAAQSSDERAKVIIYRVGRFTGKALEPSVFCDGAEIARMDNGRYFTALLPVGKHVIKSNDEQTEVLLDAKAGEVYYVRVNLVRGAWKGWGGVTQASEKTALEELKKLKPLGLDKVKEKDRVSVDPIGN